MTDGHYYESCSLCKYADHRCMFCGEFLDHASFDPDGNHHDVATCRPDLEPHEPGPLCTWPEITDPKYAYLNEQLGRPNCYWDHENGRLKD